MAATQQCQPSTEEANQYLVITTCMLAAVGFLYLLKLLYQSLAQTLFSHRSHPGPGGDDVAREENIGFTLLDHAPANNRTTIELESSCGIDGGHLSLPMPELPELAYCPAAGRL